MHGFLIALVQHSSTVVFDMRVSPNRQTFL